MSFEDYFEKGGFPAVIHIRAEEKEDLELLRDYLEQTAIENEHEFRGEVEVLQLEELRLAVVRRKKNEQRTN